MAVEIIGVLDGVNVDYVLGGSLASSTFGEPRATNDIDIAVSLTEHELALLSVELHRSGYYIPDSTAGQAVTNRSSFNVIHPSGFKIDFFVIGDDLLDRWQMDRRVLVELPADPPRTIWVTSPADQILRKLDWYRLGGEMSDRQWRDILGVLRAQRDQLDLEQLASEAERVALGELLDRALRDGGPIF